MDIMSLIVAWVVTSISLLIVSKLPTGVEIDTVGKAATSAIVFGLLNAVVRPVFVALTLPFTIISFGLFLLVVNAVIFGLAAALVEGFRLRWGIISAFIGSLALSLVNSILYKIIT